MSAIMFVRITSALTAEEVDKRKPRFLPVAGLIQKIYGRDPATGDLCGIYCFDSGDALTAFQESELAGTIPGAYEATTVRREVYDVLYLLRPNRGPFTPTLAITSMEG